MVRLSPSLFPIVLYWSVEQCGTEQNELKENPHRMFDDLRFPSLKDNRRENSHEHDEDRLNDDDNGAQNTIVSQAAGVRVALTGIDDGVCWALVGCFVPFEVVAIDTGIVVFIGIAATACVGTQSEALSSSMNALTNGKRPLVVLSECEQKPYLHGDWTFMCFSERWLRIGTLVDVNRRDVEIRDEKVTSQSRRDGDMLSKCRLCRDQLPICERENVCHHKCFILVFFTKNRPDPPSIIHQLLIIIDSLF